MQYALYFSECNIDTKDRPMRSYSKIIGCIVLLGALSLAHADSLGARFGDTPKASQKASANKPLGNKYCGHLGDTQLTFKINKKADHHDVTLTTQNGNKQHTIFKNCHSAVDNHLIKSKQPCKVQKASWPWRAHTLLAKHDPSNDTIMVSGDLYGEYKPCK